jgi:hypothetical protein
MIGCGVALLARRWQALLERRCSRPKRAAQLPIPDKYLAVAVVSFPLGDKVCRVVDAVAKAGIDVGLKT